MKSRFATVLVVLVATAALTSVAASSASAALPEFTPGTHGFPLGYMYSGQTAVWQKARGATAFVCSSVASEGKITDTKTTAPAKIQFRGCKIGTTRCFSEGTKSEEILTVPLEGKLVYLSKVKKTVAILFKPVTGTTVAKKVKCGAYAEGDALGSVLMPLSLVNVLTSSFQLLGGAPETYENEAGEVLHAGMTTKMFSQELQTLTWSFESVFSTQAAIEVKA